MGIPDQIELKVVENIISNNQIPVVAPLGLDKNNQVYNINGDTAANYSKKT